MLRQPARELVAAKCPAVSRKNQPHFMPTKPRPRRSKTGQLARPPKVYSFGRYNAAVMIVDPKPRRCVAGRRGGGRRNPQRGGVVF